MLKLRDFLYLDERTVKRYLSSIEEGLVKEIFQSSISEKPNWDFDISLGELQRLLVAAGIPIPNISTKRKGKSESISVNISKEPTIDSQFDKLFKYLDPALQYLEGFDREIWSQLEEGQFVCYTSNVNLPKGYENAQVLKIGTDFYEFGKMFGIEEDKEFEKTINDSRKYIEEAESKTYTNVYSVPTGSPDKGKYYFVSKIIHDNLVDVALNYLSFGTFTMLGRVEHILQSNERYTIFDASLKGASSLMNREERRKQKDNMFEIATKPAIILRPVAIFKE